MKHYRLLFKMKWIYLYCLSKCSRYILSEKRKLQYNWYSVIPLLKQDKRHRMLKTPIYVHTGPHVFVWRHTHMAKAVQPAGRPLTG